MAQLKIVKLTSNMPIPDRHLSVAKALFDKQGFDYYPQAVGYEVKWVKGCTYELGKPLDENDDGRFDVECSAGLVKTPLRALGANLGQPYYICAIKMGRTNDKIDLHKIVGVGDVIAVTTLTGFQDGGTPDYRYENTYKHSMFVDSPPRLVAENTWKFRIFHSQRVGEGPEYSEATVRWTSKTWDLPGNTPEAFFLSIDTCPYPFTPLVNYEGAFVEKTYDMATLYVESIGKAYNSYCKEIVIQNIPPRPDPLVFDLFGDGIHTVGTDADLYFDQNGDGFGELTGWVDWGSGMLMLDHNGNGMLDDGSELFGNNSILPDGTVAADGFAALAYYDTNGDGWIDADDPIWSELRMWQGQYSNLGHIGDPHEQGVLSTLDELGIAAINLDYTDTNIADEAGNTELRTGGFVWADGTAGSFAEYSFDTDMSDTVLVNVLEVSPEISALPQLFGAGTLRDLHQAMAQESDGELRALLEAFADETDVEARSVIFLDLLYKWTGAESVLVNALGSNIDARRVEVLNMIFGGLTDNGGSSEFQVGAGGSLAPSSRFRHPNAPEICQGPSLHTQTGHWPTTTIQFPLPPWRLPTTRSRKCRGKPMAFGSKCYSDSRSMDYISSTTHLSDEPKNIRSTARSRMNM